MMQIFPSLIGSDLLHLGRTIEYLNPYVDGYHIDIMDNHFVPHLTWGPLFIESISQATTRTLWIHLMITNPYDFIKKLSLPQKTIVTFHIESKIEIEKVIQLVRENKWHASIAINPKTPVEEIFPFLNIIDQILIMSVEPGFSGQQFLPSAFDKIDRLLTKRELEHSMYTIAIDGGITHNNISAIAHKKVDMIATASAIFQEKDIVHAFNALKKKADVQHPPFSSININLKLL